MRKRIFEIIEKGKENDIVSKLYDALMMLTIIVSIFPLMFKNSNEIFIVIDKITVVIFIVDYILRLITADLKIKKGKKSFLIYPFTFMAIIDLISILPSLTMLNNSFRIFKIFRMFKTFKVFRVFKAFRYSKSIEILINVFKEQKNNLIIVGIFALGYIFISALVIFNVEPETFNNFFDAVYWATVSLTTVGYGDIYATSDIGQVITMISALLGVAIVALPAGIISAGYINEINKKNKNKKKKIEEKK